MIMLLTFGFEMSCQGTMFREGFTAVLTLVRFLTSMTPDVSNQATLFSESTTTQLTHPGKVLSVSLLVTLECTLQIPITHN